MPYFLFTLKYVRNTQDGVFEFDFVNSLAHVRH